MQTRTLIAVIAAALVIGAGAIVLVLQEQVGRLDAETLTQWGEIPVMVTAPVDASLWVDDRPVERAAEVETVIVQLTAGDHALRALLGDADETFDFAVVEGAPPIVFVQEAEGELTFEAK